MVVGAAILGLAFCLCDIMNRLVVCVAEIYIISSANPFCSVYT